MPAVFTLPRAFSLALGLMLSLTANAGAMAQASERLVQMTAVFEEVEPALRALATCRVYSQVKLSEKAINEVRTSLRTAELTDPEMEALLLRLKDIRPYLGDDRPVAEMLVFCQSVLRQKAFSIDTAFSLMDRLAAAATQPPGKDDAQIIEVMTAIIAEQNQRSVCFVPENGPLPKRTGISADGMIGKELARFDISPPVRSYIDSLFALEPDFGEFANIGALRSVCVARSDALKKFLNENKKPPPSAVDRLKAMQPAQ